MLATLNDKNDPHDVIEIAPDIVLASRTEKDVPTLAPELSGRPEPKLQAAPEPKIAAPSVDAAVRAALSDYQASRKRSSIGKWLSGAMFSMLFAGGSAAAAIAWQAHGDTVKQMAAAWIPAFVASPSQTAQAADEQPVSPAPQAQAADETALQATTAPVQQPDSATPTTAAVAPDTTQSLQSMARDLATMGQQVEQLKASIAELKASQEQMAREMAKPPLKPSEARAADPHAKMTALPPRPPAPSVRKPKSVSPPPYPTTYAPAPITPTQQATVVPPPPMPAPAPQQTADDDGPVVRPPMPVR